jgi:hypothetical protein
MNGPYFGLTRVHLHPSWPPGQADSHPDGQRTCARADRHTRQQRAAALPLRWAGHAGICKARLDAGCYLSIHLVQERCHYGVAVFGAKLPVNRGGGPDVLRIDR